MGTVSSGEPDWLLLTVETFSLSEGLQFKTDDACLQTKKFINAEDTENSVIAWNLDDWFQGEVDSVVVEKEVLKSMPASFRFPFPYWWGLGKTQDRLPREGLWKKTKQHDWPEVICLGNGFGLLLRTQGSISGKEGNSNKRWCGAPGCVGRWLRQIWSTVGGALGRNVPMSCTPTACTYLRAKTWAQPLCSQWKLTFLISQG